MRKSSLVWLCVLVAMVTFLPVLFAASADKGAVSGQGPTLYATGGAGGASSASDDAGCNWQPIIVAPGDTFTSPDGVSVKNTGANPGNFGKYCVKDGGSGSGKSRIRVGSGQSADVSGLDTDDSCTVDSGGTANINANGCGDVNVNGSGNNATVNGNANDVDMTGNGSNNKVTINGNNNDIDLNSWNSSNSAVANGSGNTFHN